jgi:hypothetical protein
MQKAMSNCMETDKKVILRVFVFRYMYIYVLYSVHNCDGYDPPF